ncbi:Kazal-type serine protease inhibitor [Mesorhizobium sp. LHD-90]|uniref:Kazal-type serine protease inhibitor family protein n=1 Tax=Mesorhizobium sp. LHD-90 TaxID=3071414 RepID=UPI0027E0F41A|nr:Kazal-type serine protease inhibitor [Mesorhizobium sp. LHD-90]MDQ6436713.1 Kazal-type serine protease inhibitor [Mesorhizobium sp. LHD-90]
MRLLSWIRLRHAVLAVGLAILAACNVVVEESGPSRPRPDGGFCTREFDPVCGRRGGDQRTFANACLADNAGFRVVRRGECRRGDDRPDEPRACTREYDPVCARRGGDRRTFSNACVAREAGYRVLDRGECRRGDGGGGGDGPRACTLDYRPVCARRGGDVRTFANACTAESARYRIVGNGPC